LIAQLRPTNLLVDVALPAKPEDFVWPEVQEREVDEDPIPVARLLPERWVVHIPRPGVDLHAVGRAIPDDLACGPSLWLARTLQRNTEVQPPIALLRAAKAEWLVDFAAAIAVGMAVKVPIDVTTLKQAKNEGLSVRVWGVRSGDAAARVERTLASHHYTTGHGVRRPRHADEHDRGGPPRAGPPPTGPRRVTPHRRRLPSASRPR
jgi:hypothetical protein